MSNVTPLHLDRDYSIPGAPALVVPDDDYQAALEANAISTVARSMTSGHPRANEALIWAKARAMYLAVHSEDPMGVVADYDLARGYLARVWETVGALTGAQRERLTHPSVAFDRRAQQTVLDAS